MGPRINKASQQPWLLFAITIVVPSVIAVTQDASNKIYHLIKRNRSTDDQGKLIATKKPELLPRPSASPAY